MKSVLVCLMPGAKFDRATAGLLAAARSLQGRVTVVAPGPVAPDVTARLAAQADAVVCVESAELTEYQPELVLAVLTSVCEQLQPEVVLLGSDTYSQELTPRLAARLKGSSIGDAQELSIAGERLRVTRTVYGGKATAVMELQKSPAVVWVRARSFAPEPDRDSPGAVETRTVELTESARRHVDATKIIERHIEAAGDVRLEDAALIVSGGRGLGGPEPFEDLKQLASVMGAQMAASRAACDAGWVPPQWQVGQTGKKVAPELYLAVAISGASQHLMGISDAKVIAAINTDAEAPIFRHCQFGLVEDYRNVVGPLRDKLASLLS
ncbi:MAG: electron transfer flavoprotein subunit alpha/FixB family protein [Planctomycetaceae bacterium]|nr:electron transfer flavoprotein subunit alpha/FixB family protein [Planctomycetaceae bacterium]